jgi:hypothetical protein
MCNNPETSLVERLAQSMELREEIGLPDEFWDRLDRLLLISREFLHGRPVMHLLRESVSPVEHR